MSSFFDQDFDSLNAEKCFAAFDADGDGKLNLEEFTGLCEALFTNKIEPSKAAEIFEIFSKAEGISAEDFANCWTKWIAKILRPVSALIVVDVQNDFITGSLALKDAPAGQDGAEVVPPINNLVNNVPFDEVAYSIDWHPQDHVSFVDNIKLRKLDPDSKIQDPTVAKVLDEVVYTGPPKVTQTLWPRHCVQGTWGAEMHKDLAIRENSFTVKKGFNPNVDSYSAFFDNAKLGKTPLDEYLKSKGVTDIYTCGLAYDICVAFTTIDGLDLGYRAVLLEDATRGIVDAGIQDTRKKLEAKNGIVANSEEVKAMIQGKVRRAEMGYGLAMHLKNA